jgi:hypothetical protein
MRRMPHAEARSRGGREKGVFHGVENRFPLCGKHAETCFHCVENFPKHVSIVWKTPGNMFPLCGKGGRKDVAGAACGGPGEEATQYTERRTWRNIL